MGVPAAARRASSSLITPPSFLEGGVPSHRFLGLGCELGYGDLARLRVGVDRDDLGVCLRPVFQQEEPPAIHPGALRLAEECLGVGDVHALLEALEGLLGAGL